MIVLQIMVKVADLLARAKELAADGVEKVELSYIEGDDETPPALWVSAAPNEFGEVVEYDEIDGCSL